MNNKQSRRSLGGLALKNAWNGLLCAGLLAAPACAQARASKPFFEGQHSGVRQPLAVAVRDPQKWSEIWREHDAITPVPAVDFTKESVVAVFLGETRKAGVTVAISVRQDPLDPNRLNVFYSAVPSKHGFAAQVQCAPYAMVKVPRAESIDVEPDAPLSILERAPAQETPKYDGTKIKAMLQAPSFDGN